MERICDSFVHDVLDRTQVIIKNERNELIERIPEEEVKRVIEKLPKTKLLELMSSQQSSYNAIITIITAIINKIYETGKFPKAFLTSIFIPIPKATKAMKCEEFRTFSLVSHASKILLHIVKERKTPLVEKHLSES